MSATKSVEKIRGHRVLRGAKAIKALSEYITELKQQKGTELTEKQVDVMVKVAEGLIASFEREKHSGKLPRPVAATYRLTPVLREYEVPFSYAQT